MISLSFVSILLTSILAKDLTTCQKNIALKITTMFENSVQNFQFDYCQNIDDGRGYTSGIIGFTTGTMDASALIQVYCKQYPKGAVCKYIPQLKKLDGFAAQGQDADSVKGLEGYCDAWGTESQTETFQQAQINALEAMYYIPSQHYADEVGLTIPVGRSFFYDISIQQGPSGGADTLADMIERISQPGPFHATAPIDGGDESLYIKNFMAFREYVLCNAQDESTAAAWCETLYRVQSYKYVFEQTPDFGTTAEALDNDGYPYTASCYPRLV
ncbi:lysozyme-like domain-containing protein [Globomyces pollinis-pini]|nr:lysozyme-like domain-containing protein [Globomyces pollinis-pini]